MSGIPPTKSDLAFSKRDQAMVGDGYAMGVAAQILEHVCGAAEGRFRVNHPVFSEQWSQPGSEGFALSESRPISLEAQAVTWKACLRPATNLPRKTRRSTWMGRKNRERDLIQCMWSRLSPPAGMTQ